MRNWSWLLNPNNPAIPPAVPEGRSSSRDVAGSIPTADGGEACGVEIPPEEEESQAKAASTLLLHCLHLPLLIF